MENSGDMVKETIKALGFDKPEKIAKLKEFLKIGEDDLKEISKIRPKLLENYMQILDSTYEHLQKFPETSKFLPDEATIRRLKGAQMQYFENLTSGNYDLNYVNSVVRVGLAHVKIDLQPEWYLGTYASFLNGLISILFEDLQGDSFMDRFSSKSNEKTLKSIQTMVKILFFDLTLTLKSYIGPLLSEMEDEKDQAKGHVNRLRNLSNRISGSVRENNENIQIVSNAADEMSQTIREISQNVQKSTQITSVAVNKTELTNDSITKLKESTEEIGKLIKEIRSIAQQTNLLALNATIESARAGEAGKGFAVVANEVKDLSKGTAKVTEEISHKIASIQKETLEAVDAIKEVQEIIQNIDHLTTGIAGAVEEQSATTDQMTQNIMEAATRMDGVVKDIEECEQATMEERGSRS